MAKKLTSDDVKHLKQNRQVDNRRGTFRRNWNFEVVAFEWWEPAPDGFCSSPGRKHLRNLEP